MLPAAGGAAAAGEVSVFELTLTAKDENGQPLPARDSARVKVRTWQQLANQTAWVVPYARSRFSVCVAEPHGGGLWCTAAGF